MNGSKILFGLAVFNWLLYVGLWINALLDEDPAVDYYKMQVSLCTIVMLFTLFNMIGQVI